MKTKMKYKISGIQWRRSGIELPEFDTMLACWVYFGHTQELVCGYMPSGQQDEFKDVFYPGYGRYGWEHVRIWSYISEKDYKLIMGENHQIGEFGEWHKPASDLCLN